jgi:hypothetical protein
MNLQSVLLSLAADHLDNGVFDKMLNLVRRSELAGWNASCDSLQKSMKSGAFLPSHHWYELTEL